MPSTSPKQRRTMAACAHGADLEVCKHIPRSVAREFNEADKRAKARKVAEAMHRGRRSGR